MRYVTASPLHLRLALAQLDVTVGDLEGNEARIREAAARAREAGARARPVPRARADGLSARGPPARASTSCATRAAALERLASETQGIVALVGFPERTEDVYNALAVLADGRVARSTARSTCPTTASSTSSATSSAGDGRRADRARRRTRSA
ncbi:MAG: hypothetical protein WKF40_06350 [Thermoleophilaceae bacterium]